VAESATVTIACKLPNGIHLDVFRMDDFSERTIHGTVIQTKRAVRTGRFTLKGIKRRTDDSGLAMGFALTHGVPKAHWDAWLEANKDSPLVQNGIIFASSNSNDARARAREHEAQVSGFEPLNPKDLPKEFRGKIETADRPAA
jgi:hypothetical protein